MPTSSAARSRTTSTSASAAEHLVLAQIILDSTEAADQIPDYAQGRFITQDGTVFQAYWFDDTGGL